MYEAFFGLREPPFRLTPDPEYLFLDDNRREAVEQIGFGIDRQEGFFLLAGEVGLGKTTLCHALLDRLGPRYLTSFVFHTVQTPNQLLRAIVRDFGCPAPGRQTMALVDQLNAFLLARHEEGRVCLLVIDEAQGLSNSALELLRMLSNLETRRSKLIRMILVGQPELATRLGGVALRQLDQRISVRFRLSPMSLEGTRQYVRHRLRVAGNEAAVEVTDAAWEELHRTTCGTPRLTNLLADRALLSAYVHGVHRIEGTHIQEAVASLCGEPHPLGNPFRARVAPAPATACALASP
jgi:general secretion pathway protein A